MPRNKRKGRSNKKKNKTGKGGRPVINDIIVPAQPHGNETGRYPGRADQQQLTTPEQYEQLRSRMLLPNYNWIFVNMKNSVPISLSKLARKLPKVVLDSLCDGSLSPEAAVEEEIGNKITCLKDPIVLCHGRICRLIDVVAIIMTEEVIPPKHHEELGGMAYDFFLYIRSKLVQHGENRGHMQVAIQLALMDEAWNKKLDDAIYGGKEGTFYAQCKITQEEGLYTLLRECVVSFKKDECASLCRAIAQGEHLRQCWECGASALGHEKCGKCNVARYCNRDCQQKAWHNRHRRDCQEITKIVEFWDEQSKILKRKQQTCEESHRFRYVHGFEALKRIIESFSDSGLHKFTMDVFCEDIDRILDKQWWIDERATTMEQYVEYCQHLGKEVSEEVRDDFRALISVLALKREHRRGSDSLPLTMPRVAFLEQLLRPRAWSVQVLTYVVKSTERECSKQLLRFLRDKYAGGEITEYERAVP